MTEAFNRWWDSDELDEDNPYELESALFWAWEGWQAAMKEKREWQGLTDEDIWELVQKTPSFDETVAAVEAKLKEKNT